MNICSTYFAKGGTARCVSFAICALLTIFLLQGCNERKVQVKESNAQIYDTLRIAFTGDVLLDRGVRKVIERRGVDSLFAPEIDSLFASCDMVVANLECPATSIVSPINKRFI